MNIFNFNYISVPSFLITCAVHVAFRTLWYSEFMFARTERFLSFGIKDKQVHFKRSPRPGYIALVIGSAMVMPFFLLLLRFADCRTPYEGILWGLAVSLFDLGLNASHNLFEDRPFELFLLHRGCHTITLVFVGALLPWCCTASTTT